MNRSSPSTAIILVSWNSEKYIRNCLNSLANQSVQDFDVVFVDNGSSDNSAALAQKTGRSLFHDLMSLITLSTNLGFCAGHNRGFDYAVKHKPYEFLVALNLDTTVDRQWFAHLRDSLRKDNSAAIATSNIQMYYPYKVLEIHASKPGIIESIHTDINYKSLIYTYPQRDLRHILYNLSRVNLHYFKDKHKTGYASAFNNGAIVNEGAPYYQNHFFVGIPFRSSTTKVSLELSDQNATISTLHEKVSVVQNMGGDFDKIFIGYVDRGLYVPVPYIGDLPLKKTDCACGCAMMLRTADYMTMGGFDETLFSYFEDIDISERYKQAGRGIILAKNAIVKHYLWSSSTDNAKIAKQKDKGISFRHYYGQRNRLVVIRRYHGKLMFFYAMARSLGNLFFAFLHALLNPEQHSGVKAQTKGIIESLSLP